MVIFRYNQCFGASWWQGYEIRNGRLRYDRYRADIFQNWKAYCKDGTFPNVTHEFDATTHQFHITLYDGKPESRSLNFTGIFRAEEFGIKIFLLIVRYADPVISDTDR